MHKAAADEDSCLDYAMTLSITTFNIAMVCSKHEECGHTESNGYYMKFKTKITSNVVDPVI
jgi:hypothetical protein